MSEKRKFDAILALPFGSKGDHQSANWHIALRAAILAVEQNLPLVVHARVPIKTVVASLPPYWKISLPSLELIDGHTICDTANNFYSFAGWETWKNILLVTGPPIANRCIRDIGRVSGGRFDVRMESELIKFDKRSWFNREDKRFFVRHPILCHLWEIGLHAVPWSVYEKFAHTQK